MPDNFQKQFQALDDDLHPEGDATLVVTPDGDSADDLGGGDLADLGAAVIPGTGLFPAEDQANELDLRHSRLDADESATAPRRLHTQNITPPSFIPASEDGEGRKEAAHG
ncbi:hypothetical protein [Asticcacaulis sp. YBE204]|uniref:hypothetical protein n=1 Tax=Asticcacaulis sp. YBE204 TaxID=1282363 RepID=UPI0003C3D408|nr:hypothetical protein [Asticcacaulis sp. YBE204]ESQ80978.1 hypothetical protein AEYBE204_01250 [Asticcacaulis sp. YBE204]